MLDALNITEEEAAGLGELAMHDLALARDFARRAQAAEEADEASRLARSYQRAARSYRQTLALKARLRRDLAQADAACAQAQANTPKTKPGGAAIARRIADVRAALIRMAWEEVERLDAERPEDETQPGAAEAGGDDALGGRDIETFAWIRQDAEGALTEDRLAHDFGEEPLDDHVARLALTMGFRPETIAAWRDLPDPPDDALAFAPDDDDWRSSA